MADRTAAEQTAAEQTAAEQTAAEQTAASERVRIDRLLPGGDGFARLSNGCPVFVSGGLPGDVVEVQRLARHSGYARAERWRLLEPSTERVVPPCPVAETCGGCNLMALGREAQRAAKLGLLQEALRRTGGFHELPNELQLFEAEPLAYRSRVRVRIRAGQIGFYARGSHQLVVFDECLVSRSELRAALQQLRAWVEREAQAFAVFEEAEIRAFDRQRPALCLWLSSKYRGLSPQARKLLSKLQGDFCVGARQATRRGERILYASRHSQRVELLGVSLRLGPFDFSQVNWRVNQALVQELLNGVKQRSIRSFLDLYCGAGNFSLPLLFAGLKGVGIEANATAVENARLAADEQGLDSEGFWATDVNSGLRQVLEQQRQFDLAVVDPPRAGAKSIVEPLAQLAPQWVFMCSCDPTTFARDLKRLVELGFELQQLRAYDMFPQTHHLEASAWLKRAATDGD